MNWRKQLPPPLTHRLDPSHLPLRKPSSDAPSPILHPTGMVYEHFSWKADCIATPYRADTVLLARLCSGHTPILKAYAHLLDSADDRTRSLCKEEPQTLEHWLQRCPNLNVLRQHTFGRPHSESSCPTPRRWWCSL